MSFRLNTVYSTNNPDYKIMITTYHFRLEGKTAHVLRVFYKHNGSFEKLDCFFNCIPEFDHGLVQDWTLQFQNDPVNSLAEHLKSTIWNKKENSQYGKWLIENGFKDMVK